MFHPGFVSSAAGGSSAVGGANTTAVAEIVADDDIDERDAPAGKRLRLAVDPTGLVLARGAKASAADHP